MDNSAKNHQVDNKLLSLNTGITRVDEGVVYPAGVLSALDRVLGFAK